MADLFDYIEWRGDLSFSTFGFCDADALVLSRISYLPFDNVVTKEFENFISLGKACEILLNSEQIADEVLAGADITLMHDIIINKRFSEIMICGFVNNIDDDSEMQFSAMIYKILPDLSAVIYRGTDNTIVGWKEDFNMSFSFPVPSQISALKYIEAASRIIKGRLIVAGHSKGGNLAVYASSMCTTEIKNRIDTVYNLDGPGFSGRVLDTEIYSRTRTFVPQTSVVGMILGHSEEYTIIHSSGTGLMQHDLFSWKTERAGFDTLEKVTDSGRFLDETLCSWLSEMTSEQRENFTDALFSVLTASGAQTLKDLTENRAKNAVAMIKTFKEMDEVTRKAITRTISLLFKKIGENISLRLPGKNKRNEEKTAN